MKSSLQSFTTKILEWINNNNHYVRGELLLQFIKKLNDYQLEITHKLLENNAIVQAIANPSTTFYSDPLPIVEVYSGNAAYEDNGIIFSEAGKRAIDKSKLLFHNIFPWQHIEKDTNTNNTFLTFHFPTIGTNRNIIPEKQNYKINCITFCIYCQPAQLPLDNGELRTLFIASEIDQIF